MTHDSSSVGGELHVPLATRIPATAASCVESRSVQSSLRNVVILSMRRILMNLIDCNDHTPNHKDLRMIMVSVLSNVVRTWA